jgi:dihydroorotase-like cyclic amidohydrolase
MTNPREVDLAVVGGTLVTPSGARRAGVAIDGGRIVAVGGDDVLPPARRVHDATGLHVLPGLVDPEAHPGCYVPLKDDLLTETRAAAAAGVTTWGVHAPSTRMGHPDFAEFVQPEDVVSFHEPFAHFTELVASDSAIDIYLTYMLETDQQAAEIPEYAREHGVTSYKLYLQSMSPEAEPNWPGRRAGLGHGFDDGTCFAAMEAVAALGPPGVVCMHCENWEIARIFDARLKEEGREDWAAWSDRSPHFLEAHHVRSYGYLAEVTGCPIYIQHATTPETYREIADLRARGVTCHAQTGPHWLHFGKGEPNAWRINVPLRGREHIPGIWRALRDGMVGLVGSDHVVSWPPSDYASSYDESVWSLKTGFTSRVEMHLPVLLEGVHRGDLTLERLVQVACAEPARVFGLSPRKGSLEPGADADLVLVDLDRTVRVSNDQVLTRSGWTVLDGQTMHGWPVATFLRGTLVARWEDGAPGPEYVGDSDGVYLRREPGGAAAAAAAAGAEAA